MKKVLATGLIAGLLASSIPTGASAADFTTKETFLKGLSSYQAAGYQKAGFTAQNEDEEEGYLEEVEPNDTLEQANLIPDGMIIGGKFDKAADTDFYKIELKENNNGYTLASANLPEAATVVDYQLLNAQGEVLKPVETESEGSFTAKVYNLPKGTYYAHAVEKSGKASTTEEDMYVLLSLPVDETAPATPTVNKVDDNDKKITGKAEPFSEVAVLNGSKEIGWDVADEDGTFTINLRKAQKAGSTLYVSATDDYGNESLKRKVVVTDGTAPATPKVSPVDSNDKKVKGTAEAGSTVTVKVGSKVIGKATANSKGNFTVTIKAQKKGTKLYVAATDKAKLVSKSAVVVVKKA